MQQTCLLVKPDGVGLRRVGAVIDRLERANLRLVAIKMMRLGAEQAESFYKEHRGKAFYDGLIRFMTAGPIVATVWEGENAVAAVRSLMGATDPKVAAAGTLRREFGTDNRYNLVHGSDSVESAAREIAFFFKPDEQYRYQDHDWRAGEPTSKRL